MLTVVLSLLLRGCGLFNWVQISSVLTDAHYIDLKKISSYLHYIPTKSEKETPFPLSFTKFSFAVRLRFPCSVLQELKFFWVSASEMLSHLSWPHFIFMCFSTSFFSKWPCWSHLLSFTRLKLVCDQEKICSQGNFRMQS